MLNHCWRAGGRRGLYRGPLCQHEDGVLQGVGGHHVRVVPAQVVAAARQLQTHVHRQLRHAVARAAFRPHAHEAHGVLAVARGSDFGHRWRSQRDRMQIEGTGGQVQVEGRKVESSPAHLLPWPAPALRIARGAWLRDN